MELNCKNCGHPRHCGGPLFLEDPHNQVQDYGDSMYRSPSHYIACKQCRCEDCSNKTKKKNKSKAHIPSSMLNGL